MRHLKFRSGAALAAALLVGAGCKNLDVPNYTNASIDLLLSNPTPSAINTTVVGMFRSIRSDQQNETLDIYARNAYNLDPSEVRSVTVPLIGPLDPSQGAVSFNGYTTLRAMAAVVNALDQVGNQMTDQQKAGVRGFVKTWWAWELHQIIRQTDTFGAIINVTTATPDALGDVVSKSAVYTEIERLYDEAYTDLNTAAAAPNTFSFQFTSGFTSNGAFNTPSTFRTLNRALKARALADQGSGISGTTLDDANGKYAAVLAILPQTFLNATPANVAALNVGPYNIYSTTSGDQTNGLFEPAGRAHTAHPSLRTDVQYKNPPTNTQLDDRYTRKVALNPVDNNTGLPTVRSLQGVSTNLRFSVYNSADAPIPIIRNEELILLRAEARLHTGDRPGALADINTIRQVSGGLPATADNGLGGTFSGDLLLDELLYNKRYSLVYENGHRWVDLRKYGLLGKLPRQQASHVVFAQRPFPEGECTLRPAPKPAGCTTVQGLNTGPIDPGTPLLTN